MALSALTTASKVCAYYPRQLRLTHFVQLILSQANLDASIVELVDRIKETYQLILENQAPPKINATKDVLVEIAHVIEECAQFIAKYSETIKFCGLIVLHCSPEPHLIDRALACQEYFL